MIKLNGFEIKPTVFPDKTSQIWKIDEEKFNACPSIVEWIFEDEAEFMYVAQLKALLDTYKCKSALIMDYLPYARQDKEVSNQSTFALHVFMNLLNSLKFSKVVSYDVHSKVAQGIENFVNIDPILEIRNAISELNPDCIVFPDFGAKSRYKINNIKSVCIKKVRDQVTGDITETIINESVLNMKCLIVDDLCDGGATFVRISNLLISSGASEVNLYVSHGLFTKGVDILRKAGIKKIYTRKGEVK